MRMGPGTSKIKDRRGQPEKEEARCRLQEETLHRAVGGLRPERPKNSLAIMPRRHGSPCTHATQQRCSASIPLSYSYTRRRFAENTHSECFVTRRYGFVSRRLRFPIFPIPYVTFFFRPPLLLPLGICRLRTTVCALEIDLVDKEEVLQYLKATSGDVDSHVCTAFLVIWGGILAQGEALCHPVCCGRVVLGFLCIDTYFLLS